MQMPPSTIQYNNFTQQFVNRTSPQQVTKNKIGRPPKNKPVNFMEKSDAYNFNDKNIVFAENINDNYEIISVQTNELSINERFYMQTDKINELTNIFNTFSVYSHEIDLKIDNYGISPMLKNKTEKILLSARMTKKLCNYYWCRTPLVIKINTKDIHKKLRQIKKKATIIFKIIDDDKSKLENKTQLKMLVASANQKEMTQYQFFVNYGNIHDEKLYTQEMLAMDKALAIIMMTSEEFISNICSIVTMGAKNATLNIKDNIFSIKADHGEETFTHKILMENTEKFKIIKPVTKNEVICVPVPIITLNKCIGKCLKHSQIVKLYFMATIPVIVEFDLAKIGTLQYII